jgi:hypothetical protein
MLASRLVDMIEEHAEQLTRGVVRELRTDPRTPSYLQIDPHEDYSRVFAVVHNLGMWLDSKSDTATENAYRSLGQKRFSEGIPLAEVVCALMLTKQTLRSFIQTQGWVDSALAVHQQVELYALIDRFFERATYFTVLGYEAEARAAGKIQAPANPHKRMWTRGWTSRKSTTAA